MQAGGGGGPRGRPALQQGQDVEPGAEPQLAHGEPRPARPGRGQAAARPGRPPGSPPSRPRARSRCRRSGSSAGAPPAPVDRPLALADRSCQPARRKGPPPEERPRSRTSEPLSSKTTVRLGAGRVRGRVGRGHVAVGHVARRVGVGRVRASVVLRRRCWPGVVVSVGRGVGRRCCSSAGFEQAATPSAATAAEAIRILRDGGHVQEVPLRSFARFADPPPGS